MIIIDTALRRRAAAGSPIRVGLVGAGFMSRAVAHQIMHSVPGMQLVAISNRTIETGRRAWRELGVGDFIEASTVGGLNDALAAGRPVLVEDGLLLCEGESIEVLIEITGAIEFGARLALRAFECGKDVVTMNAELDATIGSVLQHHARKAGVIYTLADGDQPGVELNLWRYVRAIGLEPLVCGNIKGFQDERRNPTTQRGFAEQTGQNPYMVTSFADGSKVSFEQACVANATGMTVEMRGMRGGDFEGHIDDLCRTDRYDVARLRALGGVVDYVVKAKPTPGVFVLGTTEDPKQRKMCEIYKLGPGPLYSFYTPYHLCHFEVPLSVARVALFRDAVVTPVRPMVEVVTLAKVPLRAGQTLDGIGGYLVYGQCEKYPVSRAENLLPLGFAEGCRLKRDLPQDAAIRYDDVELPAGLRALELRREQDRLFPG